MTNCSSDNRNKAFSILLKNGNVVDAESGMDEYSHEIGYVIIAVVVIVIVFLAYKGLKKRK